MVVPGDWELLLFSRNLEDGSCTFADRYAYRMQVAWSKMDIEPDVAMTMDSYIKKLRHESEGGSEVNRCDMKGWAGSSLKGKGQPVQCRFVRFFKDPSLLIEVIFPAAKGEPPPIKNILSKLATSTDLSRWRAFGMELRTPDGMRLESCDVKPAATRFEFISESKATACNKASFGRLGMLRHWLLGSISDYLHLKLPKSAMVDEEGGIDLKGHSGAWVKGRIARRPLHRIVKGLDSFVSSAWICPASGRLYTRYHEYKPAWQGGGAPLPGYDLACCTEVRIEGI